MPRLRFAAVMSASASSSDAAMGFSTSTSIPAARMRRADARVLGSRDGEAHGVDAVGRERVEVAKNTGAEFGGNFLRALGVGVDDADELGAFDLAPDANVVASEIADADDRYANGFLAQDFLFASRTGDAVAADFAGANA